MEVMTQMITAERAFQSASQVLKMFDESLGITVTEIASFD
jgi:flagellar basal body rod protein FlgG